MPRPSERTRNRSRINMTVPGGNRRTDFRKKTMHMAHCSLCGRQLGGISNLSPLRTRKLNRGKRRVWRSNGRQVCHTCLKIALKQTVRISH